MKDFRLAHRLDNGWSVGWQHKMSVSRGIFVQFFKCKILMSGKFVSFIASCTLCIVVGAEGVSNNGLGITETTTTILNIYGIG
jgi:hypothetical protein